MRIRTYSTELWIPRPIDEVFEFFSDAHNLDLITPPMLKFEILTPKPIPMQVGTQIQYRIRWRFIPLGWLTEITAWEPPHRFIDEQLKGPYKQWIHEHTFEEKDGGTLAIDKVDYAVSGWLLEPLVHRWFVRPDVVKIFEYRQQKMLELFGEPKKEGVSETVSH